MADEKKVSGKTRAGGAAKPFPWEEAIAEQYERTKSRLKGLATEPEAELQRILEQYLPKKTDSREERLQKLEDLAMGFAGTTIGKGVLPTAAREQGLQKFLEPSAVKERLYHGTSRPDLTEFKTGKMIKEKQYPGNTIEPWAVDNRDAVFLTPSPQFSGRYSGGDWEISGGYTPTTYPVRVQVKNPWDYENPEHIESVIQAYKEKYPLRRDKSGAVPSEESLRHHWFEKNVRELPLRERDNWSGVEKADLQEIIRSLGHDAFFVKESGIKNLGVYDPRKIKSAIGNRGTYDITDPDITKAEGGLAQYGLRHSGEGVKGKGYFGAMAGRDGTVTELSAEDDSGEFPLVVPTLTAEELDRLLAGGEPTPEMIDKASSWAATRRKRGESPFASPTEVRMPRPKAEGGSIEVDNMDSILERIAADPLLDEAQRKSLIERGKAAKEKQDQLRAELEAALARDYWADRGPNSADELVLEDRPDYRLRKAVEAQYGMSTAIPSYLEKAPPFQLNENYLIDPEFVEERQSRRFYKKGGAVKKAEGGSLTDLPDEVNPSNWREHLQNNVRADARALLGAKDGGVINLDELIEKSLEKKDGGVINLDELIDWTLAKAEHRKMKAGGAVKMADGGQTFPLQRPEEVTDLKPRPRTKRDELLEMLSKGVGSVHEFVSKPFGYENPPGEMVSSLIGLPGTAKTLERMAYGDPLTSGAGMTTNLLPETTEAAFLGLGAAPTALKATKAAGKALAPTAMEMLDVQLQKMMSPYQMNVIKPEGGNWIKGAAQKYVDPLKFKEAGGKLSEDVLKELEEIYTPETLAAASPENRAFLEQRTFPYIQSRAAINRFVDKKLAKYIQNELGTPSDSLRLQADAWADMQQKLMADKQKQIDKVRADIEKARRERNVDPEVLTRSQARLRELQKEQDLIKNRKGIHSVPRGFSPEIAKETRVAAGMPAENIGVSPAARAWEDVTDRTITQASYQDKIPLVENSISAQLVTKSPEEYAEVMQQLERESLERLGGQYAVDNPEALAYGMNTGIPARDLGFDHMMDELQNALVNEALPEYLRLTPKTLDKMSVAQAAEHVDKINAWRASQKAEVDKARAANAATVVHKEYPEQGLKWVELKEPDVGDVIPEGWSEPVTKGNALQTKSVNGDVVLGESLPELIKNIYKRHPETPGNPRAALEDALKYEGEILQHCVGGYCPDVVEGRSRIFSLRDADGRPHATIEVQPADDYDLQKAINWKTYLELQEKDPDAAVKYAAEIRAGLPNKIKQIKGAQNRKPEAEFMPYIQDFVKSGDWHSVGDIGHTDLTPVEALRAAGWDVNKVNQKYLTKEEIDALKSRSGMKRGGRITKADLEREYRMAFGGGVFNTDPDITDAGRIIPEHTI